MGHPHDTSKKIGRTVGKMAQQASKELEKQGQAGRPVDHEWRRRQMLFDYGIDIGDEVKTKPVRVSQRNIPRVGARLSGPVADGGRREPAGKPPTSRGR